MHLFQNGILAIALVSTLAACGEKRDLDGGKKPDPDPTVTTVTPPATTNPTFGTGGGNGNGGTDPTDPGTDPTDPGTDPDPLDSDLDGDPDSSDCEPFNDTVYHDAAEILMNGVDDDCDPSTLDEEDTDPGVEYEHWLDGDGDGYGDPDESIVDASPTATGGYVNNSTDCDDSDEDMFPGGVEIAGNGVDEDCSGADTPLNPVYTPGVITMVIVNDGSYATGSTPSWETWAWNESIWSGYWPGLSTPAYCGTGTTSTIECEFDGDPGDLIHVNGAWDQATNWLIENSAGGTISHITQLSMNGVIYPISLVLDDTPPVGTCTCDSNSFDVYCQL